MRVVCLADTHNLHGEIRVPPGDLVIHAGDLSMMGDPSELVEFLRWYGALPHRHRIFIAGNHDFCFERQPDLARSLLQEEGAGVVYLEDSGFEADGLSLWGSPWQPEFGGWAFNLPRGASLREKWALVPARTDILVTHGPPRGILDRTPSGEAVGCGELESAVERVAPRLHVFGHIHLGHGRIRRSGTTFVNASICSESYRPEYEPIVVEL